MYVKYGLFVSSWDWAVDPSRVGKNHPLQALRGDAHQSIPDLIPRIRDFASKKAILGMEWGRLE